LRVPRAEQSALCPSRNGIVLITAALARGLRLSAIIKIVCLRRRPNLIAAPAQFASFELLGACTLWVAPMEPDRRSVTRTTISKDALLFFDAQRGVLTCRVQDVTNSGAGIELHSLNLLPLDFELSFDNFHTIRECRVIWRQGDFVGVAFQN
jgi:hypothetical protein